MMPVQFTIQELLDATSGRLLNGRPAGGVTGISTDTRTLVDGQAYLAIKGPHFDGHAFAADAVARGAAALIVDAGRWDALATPASVPVIAVVDTVRAYGALARYHRRRFQMPIVAITGSCGKTTTKEYLATLLAARGPVLKNPKTENNAIGVPRALLQLTSQHTCAVLELGTNHPGEIAQLRDIVEPTHAVILNIGQAHVEFLGSLAGVAAEKLSLLDTIPASGGIILNADDDWMMRWLADHQAQGLPRVTTFGLGPSAQVWAGDAQCVNDGMRFAINGRHPAWLPALGAHHVQDALAALACAEQLGAAIEELAPRLAECRTLAWRMEPRKLPGGPTLLCDCYNANPLSMAQAIQALAQYPKARRRLLITGEMRELGVLTTEAHCNIGKWAMLAQLDGIIAIGPHASLILAGAQSAAKRAAIFIAYQTVEEACARVPDLLGPEDVVLIKGSRAARLEQVITSCQARWAADAVLAQ